MAKIHTLKISNYRGIKRFKQVFGMTDLVCLIGRGDSGKTTILQAISVVLSPSWNCSFYDTDFNNGNIEEPIVIEASLYDVPPDLLSENRYGLHKRLLNNRNEIIDDLSQEDSADNIDILTIQLQVNKDLEPKWIVFNERDNPDFVEIRAGDRAKLHVFLMSDYFDRHFSWSKGNPLYSLLKQEGAHDEKDDFIIEAFRKAKETIDNSSFEHLDGVLKKIKETAQKFGIDISGTNTTIDFKDISVNDGKVSLHEDKVPYRQKGKGSKRLLSIAIQSELAKSGGIILIDEIEQGLEPDRSRFLAKTLKDQKMGQIFITTHSSNVLVELSTENIFLMKQGSPGLITFDYEFQGCLRNNPEAFFTKRILIGEGASEVGICRALDSFRISSGKLNYAVLGISVVDGKGANLVDYSKKFKLAGYDVCVICDCDDEAINKQKLSLKDLGINIIECESGNCIEYQLFIDLPWSAVQRLINYSIEIKGEQSITNLVGNQYEGHLPEDWSVIDSLKIRVALAKASTFKKVKKSEEIEDKGWFKMIHHGEYLGQVWFEALSEISNKHLFKQYEALNSWIENV
jgi:putative ATP-dependent endonuclease of the OLD family